MVQLTLQKRDIQGGLIIAREPLKEEKFLCLVAEEEVREIETVRRTCGFEDGVVM